MMKYTIKKYIEERGWAVVNASELKELLKIYKLNVKKYEQTNMYLVEVIK